jgi:phosphoribosylformylglycinamidine synthase
MKYNIIIFPGSNCDYDAYFVAKNLMGDEVEYVWHKDTELNEPDCVIIPGGFSYGDYLRAGAIAKFSPIMKEVISFAQKGGLVIGICNGFQVLTETELLPGALLQNKSLLFICKHQYVKIVNASTPFTHIIERDRVLDIPIGHNDGNYFIDEDGLKSLQDNEQIVFQYCDKEGVLNDSANPNGSLLNIAGIVNKKGNVLGMMPHPERTSDPVCGVTDGQQIFLSIKRFIEK